MRVPRIALLLLLVACGSNQGAPVPPAVLTAKHLASTPFAPNACPPSGAAGDECKADTDCPDGTACLCASLQYGNAVHVNRCVASGCRGDADCSPGGACVLAMTGCRSSGYECATAADECRVDVGCQNQPDAGGFSACVWSPEVGRLRCQVLLECPAG
jgi:hypothetical protein